MMDRHKVKQLYEKVDELLRFGSPSCICQANSIMIENYIIITRFALDSTKPKSKPKHTIADNYPAGGLSRTEPCIFCEDYEKLEARLATAEGKIEKWKALEENSWDLRCIDVPTVGDDFNINWIIIEHHMTKPKERQIGCGMMPLMAIEQALKGNKENE